MLASRVSAASVEPVAAAVACYADGLPLDPRALPVSFGLAKNDVAPPAFDLAGTWDVTLIGGFTAEFSAAGLEPGTYYVWIQIGTGATPDNFGPLKRQIGQLIVEESAP